MINGIVHARQLIRMDTRDTRQGQSPERQQVGSIPFAHLPALSRTPGSLGGVPRCCYCRCWRRYRRCFCCCGGCCRFDILICVARYACCC